MLFYLNHPADDAPLVRQILPQGGGILSLGNLNSGSMRPHGTGLKLFLGNVALAVVTLGFGLAYRGYRNWAFMVRHMQLYGEINIASSADLPPMHRRGRRALPTPSASAPSDAAR